MQVPVLIANRTDATRKLAIALSIYAAIRILTFVLAFPLFNNVDEKWHFLTIQMYAQGHLPGSELPHIDQEFVRTFLPYWSPEYWGNTDFINQTAKVPLYQLSPQARDAALAQGRFAWQLEDLPRRLNFEAQAAPLYYVIAAGWYNVGAALGLQDWRLAYWVRLLNPIAYGLLVWLSYKFMRRVYPERPFLYLAVPALIAVFPQDVFFGMNRDVLSPTMWAAVLLLMVDAVGVDKARYKPLLLASLLVGLTFLVEVSNCVLYPALAATIWIWLHRSQGTLRHKVGVMSACVAAACLPPLLWMGRNYLVMGDLTGGRAKAHSFLWTVKPLGEMFHHPLFSLRGSREFLLELTRRFWHGEYAWHEVPMRSAVADRFYVFSSALFVLLFAIDFVFRRREIQPLQRLAAFQALFLVASSVLFLAAISLPFDFHDWPYPSRLYPYFVSGRIISGILLPFALMYASGLELVTKLFRKWVPPAAVLACLMLFITASEIRVRSVVFSSSYNYFALSSWRR
jgi:hypothetical protein